MLAATSKRGGGALEDDGHAKRARVEADAATVPFPSLSPLPAPVSSAAAAVAAAAAAAAAAASPLHPHTGPLAVAEKLDVYTRQIDESEASVKTYKQRSGGGHGLTSPSATNGKAGEDASMVDVDPSSSSSSAEIKAEPGAASPPPTLPSLSPSAASGAAAGPAGGAGAAAGAVAPAPPAVGRPEVVPIFLPIPTHRITCPHEGCTSKFTSEKGLARHMSKHATDRKPSPHICDTCKATFATKANLKVHTRIHTGEKPFKCDTCGKQFRQLSGLEGHKKIHTGERPYGCERCGKTFAQKGTLHQHVLSHTGEKPHKCDTCQRGFTQLSTLLQHKRTHTGARPFVCKECNKVSERTPHCTSSLLQCATSSPPVALTLVPVVRSVLSLPPQSYPQQTALNQHIRTHTKEKPFVCSYDDAADPSKNCKKTFTCKANLKAHMRFHTGEKPYVCKHCKADGVETAFAQYTTLKYHEKTKHSNIDPAEQKALKQQEKEQKLQAEQQQLQQQQQQATAAAGEPGEAPSSVLPAPPGVPAPPSLPSSMPPTSLAAPSLPRLADASPLPPVSDGLHSIPHVPQASDGTFIPAALKATSVV